MNELDGEVYNGLIVGITQVASAYVLIEHDIVAIRGEWLAYHGRHG